MNIVPFTDTDLEALPADLPSEIATEAVKLAVNDYRRLGSTQAMDPENRSDNIALMYQYPVLQERFENAITQVQQNEPGFMVRELVRGNPVFFLERGKDDLQRTTNALAPLKDAAVVLTNAAGLAAVSVLDVVGDIAGELSQIEWDSETVTALATAATITVTTASAAVIEANTQAVVTGMVTDRQTITTSRENCRTDDDGHRTCSPYYTTEFFVDVATIPDGLSTDNNPPHVERFAVDWSIIPFHLGDEPARYDNLKPGDVVQMQVNYDLFEGMRNILETKQHYHFDELQPEQQDAIITALQDAKLIDVKTGKIRIDLSDQQKAEMLQVVDNLKALESSRS